MKPVINAFITVVTLAILASPVAPAAGIKDRGKIVSQGEDGSVCHELDVTEDEAFVKKVEAAEKTGKLKEAFDAADKGTPHGCWDKSYERMAGIIERTYKKLGQEAEKGGRIYEAHKYFIYPFKHYIAPNFYRDRFEKHYSLADAHRTMLAYAKANPDDYKIVQEAVSFFESWEDKPPQLKEVRDLAMRGGDKVLAREDKAFAVHKYQNAFDLLEESGRWFELAGDEQRLHARAKQRVDSLLAQSAYDAIEQAFDYCNVRLLGKTYTRSYDAARIRAGKLGNEAERKGDLELAERFYGLAGDNVKQDAISRKITVNEEQQERQKEQVEAKRKEKFKQEQKSLEEELGF